MVLETVEHTAVSHQNSAQIQRLAWIIVLVSFMLFCSISIATFGSVYYFLFRSTVVMDVSLQVGRGSAGLDALEQSRFIPSSPQRVSLRDFPATVTTDTQSQLVLSIEIPNDSENIILGTITLENSSQISLENAVRPRFDWSDGIYRVQFDNFVGEADIFVPHTVDSAFEIEVSASDGASYLIADPGRYRIQSNETSNTIISIAGKAILLSPNRRNNRLAIEGQQVILRRGGGTPIVQDAPRNLLRNGLFAFDIPPEFNVAPQGWVCFNPPANNAPVGQYYVDSWQSRPALRLIRTTADSNSQTGCYQDLEIDVSSYSYLELSATVALNYQSLQNCGERGSECPMMIFINFTDRNGNAGVWYQGLFYNYVAQSTYLTSCLDCGGSYEHRPISQQVWYTYDSGNLMNRFLQEQQPAVIHDVRFYASGHEYDVFVSEIALFAGQEQVVPQNPNNN